MGREEQSGITNDSEYGLSGGRVLGDLDHALRMRAGSGRLRQRQWRMCIAGDSLRGYKMSGVGGNGV